MAPIAEDYTDTLAKCGLVLHSYSNELLRSFAFPLFGLGIDSSINVADDNEGAHRTYYCFGILVTLLFDTGGSDSG